jgi:hypothetical protein
MYLEREGAIEGERWLRTFASFHGSITILVAHPVGADLTRLRNTDEDALRFDDIAKDPNLNDTSIRSSAARELEPRFRQQRIHFRLNGGEVTLSEGYGLNHYLDGRETRGIGPIRESVQICACRIDYPDNEGKGAAFFAEPCPRQPFVRIGVPNGIDERIQAGNRVAVNGLAQRQPRRR